MSNEINTGGPAFPTDEASQNLVAGVHFEGMTIRDYFAAKALVGFLVDKPNADRWPEGYAANAYMQADAMIHARKTKS